MQIRLNLSKRPFTNHRLLWIAIGAVFFICFWTALWIKAETVDASRAKIQLEERIRDRQSEFERLKQEEENRKREEAKIVLSREEATQLAAARRLLPYKAFSMGRMIGDIEAFVPPDTRILSIKVGSVLDEADSMSAEVELSALGKTAAQLTDMMTRLQKSEGLFVVGDVSQSQAADTGEIPFTMTIGYRQVKRGAQ